MVSDSIASAHLLKGYADRPSIFCTANEFTSIFVTDYADTRIRAPTFLAHEQAQCLYSIRQYQ